MQHDPDGFLLASQRIGRSDGGERELNFLTALHCY
jgi:hypothetical protein